MYRHTATLPITSSFNPKISVEEVSNFEYKQSEMENN